MSKIEHGLILALQKCYKKESSTAHNHGYFFFSPFFFTSNPPENL
jgi:hypothetical protein